MYIRGSGGGGIDRINTRIAADIACYCTKIKVDHVTGHVIGYVHCVCTFFSWSLASENMMGNALEYSQRTLSRSSENKGERERKRGWKVGGLSSNYNNIQEIVYSEHIEAGDSQDT